MNDTEANAKEIQDWGNLLAHLLAMPDAESTHDAMYRIALLIVDNAQGDTSAGGTQERPKLVPAG
jgi:hypothetical protein